MNITRLCSIQFRLQRWFIHRDQVKGRTRATLIDCALVTRARDQLGGTAWAQVSGVRNCTQLPATAPNNARGETRSDHLETKRIEIERSELRSKLKFMYVPSHVSAANPPATLTCSVAFGAKQRVFRNARLSSQRGVQHEFNFISYS